MKLKEKLFYGIGIPVFCYVCAIIFFIIGYNPPMKHDPDVRALTYIYNKLFE